MPKAPLKSPNISKTQHGCHILDLVMRLGQIFMGKLASNRVHQLLPRYPRFRESAV